MTDQKASAAGASSRPKCVVNENDLPWVSSKDLPSDMATAVNGGEFFAYKRKRLGAAAGGQKLGASIMEVPPGKTAWPFHYHHVRTGAVWWFVWWLALTARHRYAFVSQGNEEAIYILGGRGTLRLGGSVGTAMMPAADAASEQLVSVSSGDYIALPVGGAHAHQLINTDAQQTLRYLCLSTNLYPEVCAYPDAGKVGVIPAYGAAAWFDANSAVPYYKGEGAKPALLSAVANTTPVAATTSTAAPTTAAAAVASVANK